MSKQRSGSGFNLFWIAIPVTLVLAVVFAIRLVTFRKAAEPENTAVEEISAVKIEEKKVYEKPERLNSSDNWQDSRFYLYGIEYTLPFSPSELEDHGWTVTVADDTIYGNKYAEYTAVNQENQINGYMFNPSGTARKSEDCLIGSVCFSWADAVLAGDIKIMSSGKDEVIEKYGQPDKTDDALNCYIYGADNASFIQPLHDTPYMKLYYYNSDTIQYAEIGNFAKN